VENCDDGNTVDSDGCSSTCTFETDHVCDLTADPNSCDICGNGVLKPPEVCDDGIKNDGIGCSIDCLSILPKWVCSGGNSSQADTCHPKYGDGFIIGSE